MDSSKRLLFIYNPNAGRGVVKNHLSGIIEVFCSTGYEVTVYPTFCAGDAKNIVAKCAQEYDRIVCCGGDGTLNEVTNGLMELDEKVPCGYIPAGTVNDFARSFGLPQNMIEAAGVAVSGEIFMSDIGELNGKCFDYVAAFGALADVSYETNQSIKNVIGKLAYFLEGVKRLTSIRKYSIYVEADGEIINDDVIYGMITNSFSVGGILSMSDEKVILDDGKLEALFIKAPKNVIEIQAIINSLMSGDTSCKHFYYRHIENIRIICNEEIGWTLDGEFGGAFTEVNIKTHCRCIPFIRPKPAISKN